MKIAVLSDIHDNIWNLKKALKQIQKEKCEAILFCGDYCAPLIAKTILELKLPTYAIFGNVDGAQYEITKLTESTSRYRQFKEMAEVELEGRKIAICHYPELARGLAATGEYEAVFHGHTHRAKQEKIGKALLANPGEVTRFEGRSTFGIYDTKSGKFETVEIK